MAAGSRLICTSPEVTDAGLGFRFEIERFGRTIPSFVIRYNGQVYAYLNECGHVPAELDWLPGQFFDDSKLYLICSIMARFMLQNPADVSVAAARGKH